MALPKSPWLPPTALDKVDEEHYRALVIEKAHLPAPENQSGSKRLIVETMASVGINTDVTGIVYEPAWDQPSVLKNLVYAVTDDSGETKRPCDAQLAAARITNRLENPLQSTPMDIKRPKAMLRECGLNDEEWSIFESCLCMGGFMVRKHTGNATNSPHARSLPLRACCQLHERDLVTACCGLFYPPDGQFDGRSKSQIRYGDKPRVARFREFSDSSLAKERLGERMERLIGTLSLTDELREEGGRDREEEEAEGWGEVNWFAKEAGADSGKGGMDYVEGMARRQRINAAMALLDHAAARADLAFAQTHGGDSRVRSKSN